MKKSLLALAAVATASLWPGVALADLSFNIGAVSDYRYRGISQSRLKPALQGGVDWSHASGFYLGTWASTIKWIEDANPASSNKVEIDIYGGYKGEITKGLGFDVGVLAYQYPGHKASAGGFESPNTTEIYGALTYGPATLKYSHAVTNTFGFADSKNSFYVDLSATFEVGAGITLTPHVGYQKIDGPAEDLATYTDYSIAASYEIVKGLTASLTLVDTTAKKVNGVPAYVSPQGKDLGKSGVVVGIKYVF